MTIVITDKWQNILRMQWSRKNVKSKYNVVNPDDICEENMERIVYSCMKWFLGVRTIKTMEYSGLSGCYGFLKKFYNLYFDGDNFFGFRGRANKAGLKVLHTD